MNTTNNKKAFFRIQIIAFFVFVVFFSSFFITEHAFSETKSYWESHNSVTGAYSVHFPFNYKYKTFFMQLTDTKAIFSDEIVSVVDGNNTYAITFNQSFGPPLSIDLTNRLLEYEAKRYKSLAQSLQGKYLTDRNIDINGGFYGKEIYISYLEKGKKYGIRAQIVFTNLGRIEQVLTGPASDAYSYEADDFFESIKPRDGLGEREGIPAENWANYDSPNNMYTIALPKQNKNLTPYPPTMQAKKFADHLSFTFLDPVRHYKIYYNVYSYKFSETLDKDSAIKLVFTQHIKNFTPKSPLESLNFDSGQEDGYYRLAAKIIITPNRNIPYINSVIYNIRYKGDSIVIQEIIGPSNYFDSPLYYLLLNKLQFHPEKFKPYESN